MSLEWLLKSIDVSQYEDFNPVAHQDLEIIQSEVFLHDTLIANLSTTFQIISCLVLETIELDAETNIRVIDNLINDLAPPVMDFKWDESSVEMTTFKRGAFAKMRLLHKILDIDLLERDMISKINLVLSYYTLAETPWSSLKLADASAMCLAKCVNVEESLILTLTSKASELNKVNKFNANLQKRNKLFQNINPNIGFFKTSSLELDKWKSENVKLLSTLDYLIANIKSEEYQVIVPLLLNFLDDHEIEIKTISCQLLGKLLLSPNVDTILRRYTEIFVESLEKCLMYLPSLTPIKKSLKLLQTAYDNLLIIHKNSTRKLISLIQDHVLTSIISIRDKSFEILEFFLDLLLEIVPMVKHELISTLSSLNAQLLNILIDPYLISYSRLLVKDIKIMIQIMKYCWPVIKKYKYDYLGGVILCLKNLQNGKKDDLVIANLKDLLSVLSSCCEGLDTDLAKLGQKEPILKILTN